MNSCMISYRDSYRKSSVAILAQVLLGGRFDVVRNIVRAVPVATLVQPGDVAQTATRANICALREKFAGFQRRWETGTEHRIPRDGTQLDGVTDDMVDLEQTPNSEIKCRVEANKALRTVFESQTSSIQDRLEAIFLGRPDKPQLSVDSRSDRMSTVKKDFL